MSYVVLPAGATGVDAAGNLDSSAVKAAGRSFRVLYIVGHFAVGRDEVEECWNAGLSVMLNFELEPDAYLGGYAKGRSYALQALQLAEVLGWKGESPIPFSATDTTVQDYGQADAFYKATVDVFAPFPAQSGAYGDEKYLDHLSRQSWLPSGFVLWQWMNNGPTYPWATARQTGRGSINGVSVDNNLVKKPFNFWSGDGPTKGGNDMPEFRHAEGAVYQIDQGYRTPVTGDYFYSVLRGNLEESPNSPNPVPLVISYAADAAKLDAIPLRPPVSGGVGPTNITLHVGDVEGSLS